MQKKIILLFIGLFAMVTGFAQSKDSVASLGDLLNTGVNQVTFIKENGLFIRLRTNDRALEMLKKAGNEYAAKELEDKQNEVNQKILAAFASQFTFTRVYYFYSRDMDALRKGDFSKAKNLDGTPANYSKRNFYLVDPYVVETKANGSQSTGYSLLDSASRTLRYPMPYGIIKRYGPIYKTYPQLTWDWNQQFRETDDLAKEITSGSLKPLVKAPGSKYSRIEKRELSQSIKEHHKGYKNNVDRSARPTRVYKND
ncbi:MAG: hypothetical protein V4616_11125 [Bacteroidota bacterium]